MFDQQTGQYLDLAKFIIDSSKKQPSIDSVRIKGTLLCLGLASPTGNIETARKAAYSARLWLASKFPNLEPQPDSQTDKELEEGLGYISELIGRISQGSRVGYSHLDNPKPYSDVLRDVRNQKLLSLAEATRYTNRRIGYALDKLVFTSTSPTQLWSEFSDVSVY